MSVIRAWVLTPEQTASVQGQPCVTCNKIPERAVADHQDVLVHEYLGQEPTMWRPRQQRIYSISLCELLSQTRGASRELLEKQ